MNVIQIVFENDEAFSEAVMTYQIEDLPTLILFDNSVEIRRWKGFFEDPLNVAAEKLGNIIEAVIP